MPGPYTRSKLKAEQAVRAAVQDGLNALIVNPTVPIGPGDRNLTPPAAMLSMFLNGQSPAFLDCVLNLVDVRDVAAGMVLAAERGRTGERYILGGENVALRDLLSLLERISGRPMPKRAVPGWLALGFGGGDGMGCRRCDRAHAGGDARGRAGWRCGQGRSTAARRAASSAMRHGRCKMRCAMR